MNDVLTNMTTKFIVIVHHCSGKPIVLTTLNEAAKLSQKIGRRLPEQ